MKELATDMDMDGHGHGHGMMKMDLLLFWRVTRSVV